MKVDFMKFMRLLSLAFRVCFFIFFPCLGLLDVARRTHCEVVDDITGTKNQGTFLNALNHLIYLEYVTNDSTAEYFKCL